MRLMRPSSIFPVICAPKNAGNALLQKKTFARRSFRGGKGIEIEHKEFTLVDFEEFSLQLTGLLDSIEAMQKSGENKTV